MRVNSLPADCLTGYCDHSINTHRAMMGLPRFDNEPANYVPCKPWVIPEIPKKDRWAPMFGNAYGDWFRWFAWRPVWTLDRGLVWMQPVWKRRVYKKAFLPGPQTSWWQIVVER